MDDNQWKCLEKAWEAFTPAAQVMVSFALGVFFGPISWGIIFYIVFIIAWEVMVYITYRAEWNAIHRASIIMSSILGFIIGRTLTYIDPLK